MAEMMQHLTALADEIGPRPATTDAEHRAAAYVESVFVARGLEPEIQEFDAPRTYSWAYVIYHLLTIVSAVCVGAWLLDGMLIWAGFALSAIVAFFMWSDLDTRWGLTRLMPKGPSQNVIARHIPKARRGERMKRVVIVAHYDSARSSLAFSPGHGQAVRRHLHAHEGVHVRRSGAAAVRRAADSRSRRTSTPYVWYASLVAAAYLLVPLRHQRAPRAHDAVRGGRRRQRLRGRGDARRLPQPRARARLVALRHRAVPAAAPVRRSPEAAQEAGVVPEGSLLSYTPAGGRDASTALPDDFAWAEPDGQPSPQPQRGQARLPEFETIEFSAIRDAEPARPTAPERTRSLDADWADDAASGIGSTGSLGVGEPPRTMDPTPEQPPKRGILGGLKLGRKKKDDERRREGLARRRRRVRRAQGRQGHRLVGQLQDDR